MEISRDVTFDEDATLKKLRKSQLEETYEEVVAPRDAKLMKEVAPSPDDEILEEHDMLEPQEPPHMNISHKRKPAWAHDSRSRKVWCSRRLHKAEQEAKYIS